MRKTKQRRLFIIHEEESIDQEGERVLRYLSEKFTKILYSEQTGYSASPTLSHLWKTLVSCGMY